MNKVRKLALLITLGGALWVAGTFVLLKIFGDSKPIALLVFIGWLVLAAYTIKYIGLLRGRKGGKDADSD